MTVVIVIAGLEVTAATATLGLTRAAAVILVGAGATWAAHAFSDCHRPATGRRRTTPRTASSRCAMPGRSCRGPPGDRRDAPRVRRRLAARFAIDLSYLISIGILGASGVAAGRATDLSIARRSCWGIATAAIGGVIVAVELALHTGPGAARTYARSAAEGQDPRGFVTVSWVIVASSTPAARSLGRNVCARYA